MFFLIVLEALQFINPLALILFSSNVGIFIHFSGNCFVFLLVSHHGESKAKISETVGTNLFF